MADLIVVDEFYELMGEFFQNEAKYLDTIGKEYVSALRSIKAEGICSGETAEALDAYIQLANKMNECASTIGNTVKVMMETYVNTIDRKDAYIF